MIKFFKKLFLKIASVFILFISLPGFACADSIWASDEFDQHCQQLISPDTEKLKAIVGDFYERIADERDIDVNKIKLEDYENLQKRFTRAVASDMSALEIFTQQAYADKDNCILLVDKETLQKIDKWFNLHTLWMIKAPLNVATNQYLTMEYFLIGNGRLIIGYEQGKHRKVSVADYKIKKFLLPFDNYDYEVFTSMDIINRDGKRGLYNIQTRKSPDAEFSDFHGPFNANIQALELSQEGDITTYYNGNKTIKAQNLPVSLR